MGLKIALILIYLHRKKKTIEILNQRKTNLINFYLELKEKQFDIFVSQVQEIAEFHS